MIPRSVKKICVITGSRADYGHLKPVMRNLESSLEFELQVLVIGSHWSPRHGMSVEEIRKDEFSISGEVRKFVDSDSSLAALKMMGESLPLIGEELKRLDPDFVMLLGDRTEIFAAATACHIMKIPIAHLAGGDVTAGVIDDAMRHAITKMATVHFVTNASARFRVMQLGENEESVHLTGSTAIETVRQVPPFSRMETLRGVGLAGSRAYLLVTYHPETLSPRTAGGDAREFLKALNQLLETFDLVITSPNEDPDFGLISRGIETLALENPTKVAVVKSAGADMYVNLMRHAAACVGNSSSGLYEAPSVSTPTVNIGERQAGRVRAQSVINCSAVAEEIVDTVRKAVQVEMTGVSNPYDHGNASARILQVLNSMSMSTPALPKRFVDRF